MRTVGIRHEKLPDSILVDMWCDIAMDCGFSSSEIAGCIAGQKITNALTFCVTPSPVSDDRRLEIRAQVVEALTDNPVRWYAMHLRRHTEFKSILPHSVSKVEAFPDQDALETLNEYKAKQPDTLTDAEKRRLDLWNICKENIRPLHITPELGVWNWIKDSYDAWNVFQRAIKSKYGNQVFRLSDIVDSLIDRNVAGRNERERAKHRLMDLHAELVKHIPPFPEDEFYRMLYDAYVTENYAEIKSYCKHSICRIIHRK